MIMILTLWTATLPPPDISAALLIYGERFNVGSLGPTKLILRDPRPVKPGPGTVRYGGNTSCVLVRSDSGTVVVLEAVRRRLVSDVPLGALLSGGLDSSAVVALMASGTKSRVDTFSVGFGEREFDETSYACAVAERSEPLFRRSRHQRSLDLSHFSRQMACCSRPARRLESPRLRRRRQALRR